MPPPTHIHTYIHKNNTHQEETNNETDNDFIFTKVLKLKSSKNLLKKCTLVYFAYFLNSHIVRFASRIFQDKFSQNNERQTLKKYCSFDIWVPHISYEYNQNHANS